jgi:magnesium chelatase family protein
MLVAATNLCPCGKENCSCSPYEKRRYLKHIPPAIHNRIDLYSYVDRTNIFSANKEKLQNHYCEIVKTVRDIQHFRFEHERFSFNSQIPVASFQKFCTLKGSAASTIQEAVDRFSLNGRDYAKITRLARTIADIENRDLITENDVLEALSYRTTSLKTEVSF